MKKTILAFAFTVTAVVAIAQSVTLTFTAHNQLNNYIRLDSVQITNLTRNWTQTILYPDTLLHFNNVGIEVHEQNEAFSLSQNVPNPFNGKTTFTLSLSENSDIHITVCDIVGRLVMSQKMMLNAGNHIFALSLSQPQTYILKVKNEKGERSIKMVNTGDMGHNEITLQETQTMFSALKSSLADGENEFFENDLMRYVGFATLAGSPASSNPIEIEQVGSQMYDLEFADPTMDGQPCPQASTVTDYDGNVYNTVLIGRQCWMQQNLRTTHYDNGDIVPMASGNCNEAEAARYYPNNDSSAVPVYGYLYNWPAVMHNSLASDSVPSGVQGICPAGWHVPSFDETNILKMYVITTGRYNCGTDSSHIGKSLAANTAWISDTTTCAVGNDLSSNNATGFSAMPAGTHYNNLFTAFNGDFYFWTSTKYNGSWCYGRAMINTAAKFAYTLSPQINAYSVRCLRD